jgi:hypothetical protein
VAPVEEEVVIAMGIVMKSLAGGAVLLAAGIQLIRPARTNPPTDPARTLAARGGAPTGAVAVLERACRDCHSNETRWPWYSHVAPVSWWVVDHVNHGRSHFNYSDWARYSASEARDLLKGACQLAREGKMPLPSYLRMHRDARLSPQDVETLCEPLR